MNDTATPNKKGKGCLVGCLVALALAAGITVIVVVVAYTQRDRILQWGSDRLSGGGVTVEAPEGFRSMPLPIALAVPGARASAFTGDLPAEETSAAFSAALREEGWQPIRREDAPADAFAFVVEGADGARMAMDFFEKGDEVLLLYVTGTARQTTAGLIAMPRDEARRQEATVDAEPPPAAPARRQPAPSSPPPDRDAEGREDAAFPRIPGAVRTNSSFMEMPGGTMLSNTYLAETTTEAVADHYRSVFEDLGWSVTVLTTGGQQTFMAQHDGNHAQVLIDDDREHEGHRRIRTQVFRSREN